jgi:anti-anti-sigma factor
MSSTAAHLPPKVEQSRDVRVVTFAADGVRDVENMLARDLAGCTDALGGAHLLLDFTNVERLGSVELGTLIGLHKRMKACGGRLTLFNLNAEIYEVFTAANLQTLLGICRDKRRPTGHTQTTPGENGHVGRREPLAHSVGAMGAEEKRGLAAELPHDAIDSLRRIFAPKPRAGASCLDGCKEAARALTEADRQVFALWMSRGMRD